MTTRSVLVGVERPEASLGAHGHGHGHGGGEGFHLGSAANDCVHHAPCPVLVHRPRRSSST